MTSDYLIRQEFEEIMGKAGWDLSRYSALESLISEEPEGSYKDPKLQERWGKFRITKTHLSHNSWGNLTRKLNV